MKTFLTEEIQSEKYDKNHPWSIRIQQNCMQEDIRIKQGGLGTRPMYYMIQDGNCYLGCSFPELFEVNKTPKPDLAGRLSLLCLGRTSGQETLVEDVRRFPAGDVHRVSDGQIKSHWSDSGLEPDLSSLENVADLFIENLKERVRFDSTGWLPLTGGIDSRVIASSLGRIPGLRSYTRGSKTHGECKTAAKVAETTGIGHYSYPFEESYFKTYAQQIIRQTAGMVSIDHGHAIYPLKRLRRLQNDIVIPGINGEYGRCFWKHEKHYSSQIKPEEIARKLFHQESIFRKKRYQKVFTEKAISMMGALEDNYIQRYQDASELSFYKNPIAWNDEFYLRDRVRSFTVFGAVIWDSVFKLELPFLNFDYIQAVRSLEPQQRVEKKLQKLILRKTNPELLSLVLYPSELPFEPATKDRALRFVRRTLKRIIRQKPGRNPQNYVKWLKDEAAYISPLLEQAEKATCGLIRSDAVEELWAEHLKGFDHHRILCRILTLIIFDSEFY